MRRSAALAVLAAAALTACARAGLPGEATAQSREIAGLWRVFLIAGMAVAALVLGLIGWAILRYRERPGREARTFREHVPLEILYTVVPIVLVSVLFWLTFRVGREVQAIDPDPAVVVDVLAFDWSWRFSYPGTGVSVTGTPDAPPEMVVPAGEAVRVRLRSADVIHAFFVPEFLFKRDAIPGRTTTFDLAIEEPGTYGGQCAEFCGLDHARMRFTIRAVPTADFAAWLADREADR